MQCLSLIKDFSQNIEKCICHFHCKITTYLFLLKFLAFAHILLYFVSPETF